jgi:hypothetical protein
MCALCDGTSQEELMELTRERIAAYGFTMLFVESPTPWTYTVGLVEAYGHPELVVTGLGPEEGMRLLTAVAERVRLGDRFDGSHGGVDLRGLFARFGAVHSAQWERGRFNMWVNYYGWSGRFPNPAAVQVLWPREDGTLPPPNVQPLLDCDPGRDVNGLNRAQRRRAKRGR